MSSGFVDNHGRGGAFGRVSATLVGLCALSWTHDARAVRCDEVVAPNKLFGSGDSQLTSTVRRIAVAIANDAAGEAAERTTLFYADPNACDGYADFVAGKSTHVFEYWAGSTSAETDKTCEAREGGQPLDFAHLGYHASFCSSAALPDGVVELAAPAHSLSLVTGLASQEDAISAEALYLLFGLGPGAAQVAPWSEGTGVFPSAAESWSTQLLGLAINVPAESFKWDVPVGSGRITPIKSYSVDAPKAAQALAYVPSGTADVNRANAKALAFQAYGQSCGVYPDSTPSALDKLNVRAGKYALWTNGFFYARADGSGDLLDERVENLIGWFDGQTRPPGTDVDAFAEVIQGGDVPQCAMQARRSSTLGALESFAPPKPCGCFFEHLTGGGAGCQACEVDAECSGDTPRCNFGHCESYRAADQTEG